MTYVDKLPPRSWRDKFACAFRGVARGLYTQSSFAVHMLTSLAVVIVAAALRCSAGEWCLLVLCITGVLTAEMFNTALERMAKAITADRDPHIADALDMGSAAVLLGALGSSAVGLAIFGHRLAVLLGWWAE